MEEESDLTQVVQIEKLVQLLMVKVFIQKKLYGSLNLKVTLSITTKES